MQSLADRATGREAPRHVGHHRGAPRRVDVELVADDQERLALARQHRIAAIRIQPAGEPVDIGVVAVAEGGIARRHHGVEPALGPSWRAPDRAAACTRRRKSAGRGARSLVVLALAHRPLPRKRGRGTKDHFPGLSTSCAPVPHVVDADGDVVDLAVMEAAFLALEHLEGLLLGADRVEAFLRERRAGSARRRRRAPAGTGSVIFCTMPSSRKPSSFFSAAARSGTPSTHCRCSGGTDSDSTLPESSCSSRFAQIA